MKITEALRVEHAAFCAVVEQIEAACPQIETPHEVHLLAGLVERLVALHEAKEVNVLCVAYDHVLENQGQLQRMSQERDALDQELLQVRRAETVREAKRRLRAALSRIRNQFHLEEVSVFPLMEQTLQKETLETLAEAI